MLKRFFINLVASESPIKEQTTTRFNDLVELLDVVAGKPPASCSKKIKTKSSLDGIE
ncbi:hypothetical protein CFP56_013800 [Quercus suber]|uniref:Uncharacterized protein n=1 Tax=Quercus suber TaxID=58331 RepID=A0AAW0M3X5_QUESU